MLRNTTLHRIANQGNATAIDEEAALGVLAYLDKDQLQELQDSEEKLEELIGDVQQVKNLGQDKEMLIASNKSLAEYNLSMEPKIRQGKEMLCHQYEKARSLKEEYDVLRSVIDSNCEGQSLDTTHALLQTRAAQSEEDTDRMSEKFLDKQMDCDTFLDSFMERRTTTHILKIKSEKLGDMIQQRVNHSSWGGNTQEIHSSTPSHSAHIGYATSQPVSSRAPYPLYHHTAMPSLNLPPVSN